MLFFVTDEPLVAVFALDKFVFDAVAIEFCRDCCRLVLETLITASQSDSKSVFISLSNLSAAASISSLEPIKMFDETILFELS
jgi:hypothetical protein